MNTMSGKKCVLIVDDEPGMLDIVQMYFNREGFQVELALDGHAALEVVEKKKPDLIILDLMLPKIDGLEVCRRLRLASKVPIIMLTARDEEVDKIVGLEMGADDYVTKPFNPRELVARAKAVLRRSEAEKPPPDSIEVVHMGELTISQISRIASVSGVVLELSPREFDVLWIMATHPGRVFDRDRLVELAWGYDFPGGTRTVDMHIAQLRKKLAAAGLKSPTIITVHRIGYRLDVG